MASIPGGMAIGCYYMGMYVDNGLAPCAGSSSFGVLFGRPSAPAVYGVAHLGHIDR